MSLTLTGCVVLSAVAVFAAGTAAQGYPNKPIRIVTGPVGGGNDFA